MRTNTTIDITNTQITITGPLGSLGPFSHPMRSFFSFGAFGFFSFLGFFGFFSFLGFLPFFGLSVASFSSPSASSASSICLFSSESVFASVSAPSAVLCISVTSSDCGSFVKNDIYLFKRLFFSVILCINAASAVSCTFIWLLA